MVRGGGLVVALRAYDMEMERLRLLVGDARGSEM